MNTEKIEPPRPLPIWIGLFTGAIFMGVLLLAENDGEMTTSDIFQGISVALLIISVCGMIHSANLNAYVAKLSRSTHDREVEKRTLEDESNKALLVPSQCSFTRFEEVIELHLGVSNLGANLAEVGSINLIYKESVPERYDSDPIFLRPLKAFLKSSQHVVFVFRIADLPKLDEGHGFLSLLQMEIGWEDIARNEVFSEAFMLTSAWTLQGNEGRFGFTIANATELESLYQDQEDARIDTEAPQD